mmetsp:Transcript_17414/g.44417  ORF Transcript_17414/g.44417 Transcript_17414/m.44417 type:complete len:1132 (+) Transcript_17414:2-3397(+)
MPSMPPMPSGMPPIPSLSPMPSDMPPMPSVGPPPPGTCLSWPQEFPEPPDLDEIIGSLEWYFFPDCFGLYPQGGFPDCPPGTYYGPALEFIMAEFGMIPEPEGVRRVYITETRAQETFANLYGVMSTENGTVCCDCALITGINSEFAAMHLHAPAPVGQNAGAVFTLTDQVDNQGQGTYSVGGACMPTTELITTALEDGESYLNFHTTEFPSGEVRGQMLNPMRNEVTTLEAYLSSDLLPHNSPGKGRVEVQVINNNVVCLQEMYFWNIESDFQALHIHGPAVVGQNAGVLIPLTNFVTSWDDDAVYGTTFVCVSASPTTVAAILAEQTYINFHTSAFPGGEIRGQIVEDVEPFLPEVLPIEVQMSASPGVETFGGGYALFYLGDNFICMEELNVGGIESEFTNLHIHGPAEEGGSAGVLVPLKTPVYHVLYGNYQAQWWCRGIDESTHDFIANGQTYLNFHTLQQPGGEIRGQLADSGGPGSESVLLVFDAENAESGADMSGLGRVHRIAETTFELCIYAYFDGVASGVTEVGIFNQDRDLLVSFMGSLMPSGSGYEVDDCQFVPQEVAEMIAFGDSAIVLVTVDYPEGELIGPMASHNTPQDGAALLRKDPESTAKGFPEGDGNAVAAEGVFCITEFRIWGHLEEVASFGLYVDDEFVVDFNSDLVNLGDGRYKVDLSCRQTSLGVYEGVLSGSGSLKILSADGNIVSGPLVSREEYDINARPFTQGFFEDNNNVSIGSTIMNVKPHGSCIRLEARVPSVENGGGQILGPDSYVHDFSQSLEVSPGNEPGSFTISLDRYCFAMTPEEVVALATGLTTTAIFADLDGEPISFVTDNDVVRAEGNVDMQTVSGVRVQGGGPIWTKVGQICMQFSTETEQVSLTMRGPVGFDDGNLPLSEGDLLADLTGMPQFIESKGNWELQSCIEVNQSVVSLVVSNRVYLSLIPPPGDEKQVGRLLIGEFSIPVNDTADRSVHAKKPMGIDTVEKVKANHARSLGKLPQMTSKKMVIDEMNKANPRHLLRKYSRNAFVGKFGKLGSKNSKKSLRYSLVKVFGPDARTYRHRSMVKVARNRRRPMRLTQIAPKKTHRSQAATLPGDGKLFEAANKKIKPSAKHSFFKVSDKPSWARTQTK